MYSRGFWKPVCSKFKINMMVTINKEDSAGEGSMDWQLITYPALFKSSVSHLSGIKYQFYLIFSPLQPNQWSTVHG